MIKIGDVLHTFNRKFPEYGMSTVNVKDVAYVESGAFGRYVYQVLIDKDLTYSGREEAWFYVNGVYDPYTEDNIENLYTVSVPGLHDRNDFISTDYKMVRKEFVDVLSYKKTEYGKKLYQVKKILKKVQSDINIEAIVEL